MERVGTKRTLVIGLTAVAVLGSGALAVALGANRANPERTSPGFTKEAAARVLQADGPLHEGLLANYLVSSESPPSALLTREQEELVRWALWRFSTADLDLPDVSIHFQNDTMSCGGREGLYHAATATLHICTARKQTILHELAHAWSDARLSEDQRDAFVDMRGVKTWDSRRDPWQLRGTEHASEIIAWGLMDRPTHVPTQLGGPGSETIFRLLSIPNSDVDALASGYEFLTGAFPPFRHASEWDEILDIGEPGVAYAR